MAPIAVPCTVHARSQPAKTPIEHFRLNQTFIFVGDSGDKRSLLTLTHRSDIRLPCSRPLDAAFAFAMFGRRLTFPQREMGQCEYGPFTITVLRAILIAEDAV
jgi:hypothetical protein